MDSWIGVQFCLEGKMGKFQSGQVRFVIYSNKFGQKRKGKWGCMKGTKGNIAVIFKSKQV
jgi:hypothetical protein